MNILEAQIDVRLEGLKVLRRLVDPVTQFLDAAGECANLVFDVVEPDGCIRRGRATAAARPAIT